MSAVYRLRKSRGRPRVTRRAALAAAGLAAAGVLMLGGLHHDPAPGGFAPVTTVQTIPAPQAAAKTKHPALAAAGRMVVWHGVHGLVPHPYLRPWRRGWRRYR